MQIYAQILKAHWKTNTQLITKWKLIVISLYRYWKKFLNRLISRPISGCHHKEPLVLVYSVKQPVQVNVQLPNLNINHCYINPLNFQIFLDCFNPVVNENDSIPSITKFDSLKSFLKGPAFGCVTELKFHFIKVETDYNVIKSRSGSRVLKECTIKQVSKMMTTKFGKTCKFKKLKVIIGVYFG